MESQAEQPAISHMALLGLVAALPVALFVCQAFYNVFLHPLRHVPGPKLSAMTRLVYARHHLNGTVFTYLKQLHDTYGEAVRFSPNEVSFISSETAWTDIYGFRTGKLKGQPNTYKDPKWYSPPVNGSNSLILANDEDHARERRVLAHAFSNKALSEQESLLHKYGDQIVNRLRETIEASPAPVNMTKWYNWLTFDVISDLTFGEPFGCLRDGKTHKFVNLLLSNILSNRYFYIMQHYPWTKPLRNLLFNKQQLADRVAFSHWVFKQTKDRMERETDRPDFMTYILSHNDTSKGLSEGEIMTNAVLFLGAGTETTATLLTGLTWLLCQNPAVYAKLKAEVRGTFAQYDDITLDRIAHEAPYLLACISEGLRYYPPVPAGFNRVIPQGGAVVSGVYLPAGTSVAMAQHAAYHSPRNFTDPDAFVPERWTGDAKYAADRREWVQPFSYGPRNCLGKNLAYAEARLFLAKLVWSYDFELHDNMQSWMSRNKLMFLWNKPELLVHVKPVVRA